MEILNFRASEGYDKANILIVFEELVDVTIKVRERAGETIVETPVFEKDYVSVDRISEELIDLKMDTHYQVDFYQQGTQERTDTRYRFKTKDRLHFAASLIGRQAQFLELMKEAAREVVDEQTARKIEGKLETKARQDTLARRAARRQSCRAWSVPRAAQAGGCRRPVADGRAPTVRPRRCRDAGRRCLNNSHPCLR